jgi:hypothetical protein
MAITVTPIFVCAFYLDLAPEWGTSFTLFGREPPQDYLPDYGKSGGPGYEAGLPPAFGRA